MQCTLKTQMQSDSEGLEAPPRRSHSAPQPGGTEGLEVGRKVGKLTALLRQRNTNPAFKLQMADWRKKNNIGTREGARLRLESKTEMKPNGCLEWIGVEARPYRPRNLPYPMMRFVGGKKTTIHRISYQLYVGEIPEGMLVLHKCDNPKCCLPDHLFLGTQLDNVRDCIAKGRSAARRSKNAGQANPNARVSWELVAKLRSEYVYRKVTGNMLAAKYNLSKSNAHAIIRGSAWKESARPSDLATAGFMKGDGKQYDGP